VQSAGRAGAHLDLAAFHAPSLARYHPTS
jgi:hypothetical protein